MGSIQVKVELVVVQQVELEEQFRHLEEMVVILD
jgi:hypothetical protein